MGRLNTGPWGHRQVRQRKETWKENRIRVEQGESIVTEFKGGFKMEGAAKCWDTGYSKTSEITTEKCHWNVQ